MNVFCNEAAVRLQLMEQDYSCFTVEGRGRLKVRARFWPPVPPRPRTCNVFCNGATVRLQLKEQACGCSAVQGGGGWRVLDNATTNLQCGLQRSRHESMDDEASLRLLHGARRRRTEGRARLWPPALVWRVLADATMHQSCNVFCNV